MSLRKEVSAESHDGGSIPLLASAWEAAILGLGWYEVL